MEYYSVQFLGPGWVELPPNEPARPIGLDDWRVLKAKSEGKKFLLGTMRSASTTDPAKDKDMEAKYNASLAAQKKAEGERDAANGILADKDKEIAKLNKECSDFKAAKSATPAVWAHTAFTQYKAPSLIAVAAMLILFIFAVYGWKQFWNPAAFQSTQVTIAPADYDSLKTEVAALKAKSDAREKAEKELATALKNRTPLVPLKPLNHE